MNSFIYPQLASLATAAVASFLAKEKEAFMAEVGPQAGQKVGGLLGAIEKQWRDQPAAANLLLHLPTQPNHKRTLQQRLLQK
ncbi:MAG: hypothetical protein IPL78_00100 [Chloroflexi bacterium]|nr:hypothetical protein [Chloroflexota bacterium]